jgi:hypothetical protein
MARLMAGSASKHLKAVIESSDHSWKEGGKEVYTRHGPRMNAGEPRMYIIYIMGPRTNLSYVFTTNLLICATRP